MTDTGNKRVVIFDSNGNALTSFGSTGMGVGQFDEPVGIEVDDLGRVYIADTWNMRIQVMIPDGDTLTYPTNIEWDVNAWYGDSLDNKPFLTVDSMYHTYVADPVTGRIFEFNPQGIFLRAWGGYGSGPAEIGIAAGLAVDPEGRIWVSDALNNRLMRFTLPALIDTGADTTTGGQDNTGSGDNPFDGLSDGIPTQ